MSKAKTSGTTVEDLLKAGTSSWQDELSRLAKLSYVDFCSAIGVTLEPGQRVVSMIAYDRVPISKLKGEDKKIAEDIFGEIDRIPKKSYGVFVAVCGARGGKSYILCALRLLWGSLRRDLKRIVVGNIPTGLVVAPKLDTGSETFSYIEGIFQTHWAFKASIESMSDRFIQYRRHDGKQVKLEVIAATRGGAGVRGRWYTDAVLDEVAFFRDEHSGIINDKDLYDAISPRVLPGGQVILASTPWAEAGLFYRLFRENWGAPDIALVAHAPTLTLYDTPEIRAIVEREQSLDPINADREFFAIFSSAGSEQFFSAAEIDASTKDYSLGFKPRPGIQVVAAADLGFRRDSSALVIVHIDPETDERKVAEIIEMIPEPGIPLRPSAVIKTFTEKLLEHGVQWLIGDRHYKETILEFLAEANIGYVDAPAQPADAYIRARALLREGLVILPKAHMRLQKQLTETNSKMAPGGTLTITNPRWKKGGHGDIVSALVLALWASTGETIPMPEIDKGSKAWEDKQKELRRREFERKAVKSEKWWERDMFGPQVSRRRQWYERTLQ